MIQETIVGDLQGVAASENESRSRPIYLSFKRGMDLVLALCLLTLFSPVMLLIAVVIKLDTPGPVIFVQERVGLATTNQERTE